MATTTVPRRVHALSIVQRLRTCQPEYRHQLAEELCGIATAAEIRRWWRPYFGAFPGWARK